MPRQTKKAPRRRSPVRCRQPSNAELEALIAHHLNTPAEQRDDVREYFDDLCEWYARDATRPSARATAKALDDIASALTAIAARFQNEHTYRVFASRLLNDIDPPPGKPARRMRAADELRYTLDLLPLFARVACDAANHQRTLIKDGRPAAEHDAWTIWGLAEQYERSQNVELSESEPHDYETLTGPSARRRLRDIDRFALLVHDFIRLVQPTRYDLRNPDRVKPGSIKKGVQLIHRVQRGEDPFLIMSGVKTAPRKK